MLAYQLALLVLPLFFFLPMAIALRARPVWMIALLLGAVLVGPVATLDIAGKQYPLPLHDHCLAAWAIVHFLGRRGRPLVAGEVRVLILQSCFCAVGVLSTVIYSPDLLKSLDGLKAYIMGLLTFYLLSKCIRTASDARGCVSALVCFGVCVGIELTYTVMTNVSAQTMWDALIMNKTVAAVTFGESNYVAGVILPLMPLSLVPLRRGTLMRVFSWGAASAMLGSILLTASRGALLSLVAGVTISACLRRRSGMLMALGMAASGLLLWQFLPLAYTQHLTGKLSTVAVDQNSTERLQLWDASWRMMTEHPVTGIGIKASGYGFRAELGTNDYLQAHNFALTVLAEAGLFGGAAYIASIFLVYRESIRGALSPRGATGYRFGYPLFVGFTCTLLHGMVEILHGTPQYSVIFWALAALAFRLRSLYGGGALPCRSVGVVVPGHERIVIASRRPDFKCAINTACI